MCTSAEMGSQDLRATGPEIHESPLVLKKTVPRCDQRTPRDSHHESCSSMILSPESWHNLCLASNQQTMAKGQHVVPKIMLHYVKAGSKRGPSAGFKTGYCVERGPTGRVAWHSARDDS